MTISATYELKTVSSFSYLKPAFGRLGRAFSTAASLNFNELKGYERLLKSSEREKIVAIAKTYLSGIEADSFLSDKEVNSRELFRLVSKVNKVASIPIRRVGDLDESREFLHFKDHSTFVNLPYSKKVSKWSDRTALQKLIREKFNKIFSGNDLVIIPGCAEGQIPIEVYANARRHDMELEIVAADLNLTALQLGYLTMKSFDLNGDRVHWIQTDIKSKPFFDWVGNSFSAVKRHQIVTLVQPSLREKSFLDFLAKSSKLHKLKETPTMVIMPVLLEDRDSEWYQTCDSHVQAALKASEKTRDLPQLIWNKTKYGHEMLRLNLSKEFYLPQQYFVRPEALPEIQKETGYLDLSERIFDEVKNKDKYGEPEDPRLIKDNEGSSKTKRVFCVWNASD